VRRVVVPLLLAACGDNSEGLEASASGIFPAEAFLGRRERIEITGVGTDWDKDVGVDFGDGISVGSISVAGPTTLFVDVSVDTDLPGLYDVKVIDGPETFVLRQAFLLRPPIALSLQGNIAQGSIGLFSIINRDFDAPFDTSFFQPSIFDPPQFVNTKILGPAGVQFAIAEITPYTITGQVRIDVDAASRGPVVVVSGPENEATRSPLGSSITVTPRSPVPLATPTNQREVVLPFDSHLYELTPATAPHVVRFAVTTVEQSAAPRLAILPESGRFPDVLASNVQRTTQIALANADRYYAIYFDPRGTSSYQYTLAASSTGLDQLAEVEPNDSSASAQVHAAPVLLDQATLSSQQDEDWVALEIAPADVGRRIHVITTSTDLQTDTRVDVLSPALVSLGGPSSDGDFHEDFTSTPTTVAGTHYVRVSASQTVFFDPAHNTYVAAIFLE